MNLNLIFNPNFFKNNNYLALQQFLDVLNDNVIIIDDKNGNISSEIATIISNLKCKEQKNLEIYFTYLLANKTFKCNINVKENFEEFINQCTLKGFPVDYVMSENVKNEKDINLDNTTKIFKKMRDLRNLFIIKDHATLSLYKEHLTNTIWCSPKIKIVAKEFLKSCYPKYFPKEKQFDTRGYRNSVKKGCAEIMHIISKFRNISDQKKELYIYTEGPKNLDENLKYQIKGEVIKDFFNEFLDFIDIRINLIDWKKPRLEKTEHTVHGREISGKYGGLQTEFTPFELFEDAKGFIKIKKHEYNWIKETKYPWL